MGVSENLLWRPFPCFSSQVTELRVALRWPAVYCSAPQSLFHSRLWALARANSQGMIQECSHSRRGILPRLMGTNSPNFFLLSHSTSLFSAHLTQYDKISTVHCFCLILTLDFMLSRSGLQLLFTSHFAIFTKCHYFFVQCSFFKPVSWKKKTIMHQPRSVTYQ